MKQLYPILKTIFVVFSLFCASNSFAQSFEFRDYKLVSGGEGQKGAEYRFSGVVRDAAGNAQADCIVRIENMSAGVQLKSIDQPAVDGDAAFQPLVEHLNTLGPSWISFRFSFVPHQAGKADNSTIQFPLLAASIYGLNGFERAQEFAECDLGRNSQIIYEGDVTNLTVTRNGNSFRAENRWGVETRNFAETFTAEKISLLNQQVSEFRVTFGVNRKARTWAGTSKYNLSVSNAVPELTASLRPGLLGFEAKRNESFVSLEWNTVQNESIHQLCIEKSSDGSHFTTVDTVQMASIANGQYSYNDIIPHSDASLYYRLKLVDNHGKEIISSVRQIDGDNRPQQVEMGIASTRVTNSMKLGLPINWMEKEVIVEIFNNRAEMVRKVIEHKAPSTLLLDLQQLAEGSFVIRASCGNEYAVQYAVRGGEM